MDEKAVVEFISQDKKIWKFHWESQQMIWCLH